MDTSYKNICRITFPVLVSLLVEQVIGITDTAFLGHIGKTELAASAIAGVCYLILFVIGSGFGVGLQVLIARLNGEKKHQELTATFSTGLYFLSILALFIIAVSQFLLPLILKMAIGSEAIYKAAIHYLDWRIYGLLFAFVITAFSLGELEELLDTVDRSTIFRTLTTFVEHSILHTIDDGNGHKKYCFCTQDKKEDSFQQCQHIHFTCRECGLTFCFESEHIPIVALPEGYKTEQINYLVKGICTNCNNNIAVNDF